MTHCLDRKKHKSLLEKEEKKKGGVGKYETARKRGREKIPFGVKVDFLDERGLGGGTK